MNLHGLKDENGKDVKLVVTDDPCVHPHPIWKIESIESKTEFKFETGQWVCLKGYEHPYRIEDISECGNLSIDDFKTTSCALTPGGFRHATPQEIEAHLRKICDEKYRGKETKCLYGNITVKASYFDNYNYLDDILWYHTDYHSNICVYKQGKFAEIVPDEPKELPKTVEELKELIYKFKYTCGDNYSIGEFLRKQGYKTA